MKLLLLMILFSTLGYSQNICDSFNLFSKNFEPLYVDINHIAFSKEHSFLVDKNLLKCEGFNRNCLIIILKQTYYQLKTYRQLYQIEINKDNYANSIVEHIIHKYKNKCNKEFFTGGDVFDIVNLDCELKKDEEIFRIVLKIREQIRINNCVEK